MRTGRSVGHWPTKRYPYGTVGHRVGHLFRQLCVGHLWGFIHQLGPPVSRRSTGRSRRSPIGQGHSNVGQSVGDVHLIGLIFGGQISLIIHLS